MNPMQIKPVDVNYLASSQAAAKALSNASKAGWPDGDDITSNLKAGWPDGDDITSNLKAGWPDGDDISESKYVNTIHQAGTSTRARYEG